MGTAVRFRAWTLLAVIVLIAGCRSESVSTGSEPPPAVRVEKAQYPAPTSAVADEITEVVRQWVAERADENEVFDIPPRGGRDVSGTLAEFHPVQQKDADTYTVCVDFLDGDNTYDVDFFVDRGIDGLEVRDAFLHKANGEVVSG